MHFETAEIDRHGPLKSCHPNCDDGITVIAGPNESGKTLYLEGLLRLLDPDVTAHMRPGPRVDRSPTGRLVLTDGSESYKLGNGTALSDICQIEPAHLHNLFVVRDSDLRLPKGQEYYTSLVEHLGNIHTSEINNVRSELVDRGRLTSTRLNLANSQSDDKAKDVRNEAQRLAEDVEIYLKTLSKSGVRETTRERLRTKRELATVQNQLESQRVAKRVATCEYAREQLSIYRERTERFAELEAFDAETLQELRELTTEISRDEDDITKRRATLEEKESEATQYRERLSEKRTKRTELQQRQNDIDDVERTLDAYRENMDAETSADSKLAQRRALSIAGMVGAGIAAAGGAIAGTSIAPAIGLLLLFVGVGGWYLHRRLIGRLEARETRERELLRRARDAGFAVDEPAEVGPEISQYRTELKSAREQVQKLETEVASTEDRIEDIEDDIERIAERRNERTEKRDAILNAAAVETLEKYETRVETRDRLVNEQANAERELTREVGNPHSDRPAKKIEHWEREVATMEEEVATADIDAERYDEDKLGQLEVRTTELANQIDELEADLAEYRGKIEAFERRAAGLTATPFVESEITLQAHTPAGLEALVDDIHSLVAAIERDAEVSRKAIEILDTIEKEEEQKIATLFDPDGLASNTFARLTDNRYTAVNYDPADERLEVTRANGQTLSPRQLSRGTQDQLYFAARLSLAQQLLDGDSGFLLLDDPFLAADSTRLRHGFRTLTELASNGWQIIYLTAKQEIKETMVTDFDVTVQELEALKN